MREPQRDLHRAQKPGIDWRSVGLAGDSKDFGNLLTSAALPGHCGRAPPALDACHHTPSPPHPRWEEAYSMAVALMRPLLPLIAISSGGFTALGLQWVDVFRITGKPDEFRADLLLRRDSQL